MDAPRNLPALCALACAATLLGACPTSPDRESLAFVCQTSSECADGYACKKGLCVKLPGCSKAVDCDDQNPCTDDVCDKTKGCINPPVDNGSECGAGGKCIDAFCAGPAASPWPMFAHDPQGTRRSAFKGPQGDTKAEVQVKWIFKTYGSVRSSPAITADGLVVIGSEDSTIYALDPETGKPAWTYRPKGPVWATPAIGADGTVYGASKDGSIYALGPGGVPRWTFETAGQILSHPLIGPDGTIYFGSQDMKMYALSPTGEKKWEKKTNGLIESCPVMSQPPESVIYVGDRAPSPLLHAIPDNDSTANWTFPLPVYMDGCPSVGADGTIYAGLPIGIKDVKPEERANATTLLAVKPDGTKKWALPMMDWVDTQPAIGADGRIFVTTGYPEEALVAIKPTGVVDWKFGANVGVYDSSPSIGGDGTIYFGCEDKHLYAVDPSGKLRWKYQTKGQIKSSPSIGADGTLFFGSNDGMVYAIRDP